MSNKIANNKIKIGLDLRATESGFKQHALRGTGRYVKELCLELEKIEGISVDKFLSKDFSKLPSSIPMLGRTTIETQVLLPSKINKTNLDLMHFFSHGDAPAWGSAPTVVTVLDLIPLIFAKLYTKNKSNLRFKFARFLENNAVKKAKGIIAISEATKRDVVKILDVDPAKIYVTPLAINNDFISKEVNIKKFTHPTLLYVGGIDARKNIYFLLDVLKSLVNNYSWEVPPKLLIAGKITEDANYDDFLAELKKLGLAQGQVEQLGYVSDNELISLYDSVDLFVFPSLYEGFGLPVLEAISRGCAVVAGNNSSIPEVLGSAYPLCEDSNHKQWLERIYELLTNTQKREELRKIGLEQSKLFNWANTAQETYRAYHSILNSNTALDSNKLREAV